MQAYCGTSSDVASNFQVTLDPVAPIAGQNMTMRFDYTLNSAVTGGKAIYKANLSEWVGGCGQSCRVPGMGKTENSL